MPPAQPMDMARAEIVDWEIEGKEGKTRIRVAEGATLEVRAVITGVLRLGNDPNTGLPIYNIQWQNVVSLVNCDKKLRKQPLKQPGPGEGTANTGMA